VFARRPQNNTQKLRHTLMVMCIELNGTKDYFSQSHHRDAAKTFHERARQPLIKLFRHLNDVLWP
jgi:hypothetical protein